MGGPSYSKHQNQPLKTGPPWPELMSCSPAACVHRLHTFLQECMHFCRLFVCLCACTLKTHIWTVIHGLCVCVRGPPNHPQRDWVRRGMQRNIVKASNKRTKVWTRPGPRAAGAIHINSSLHDSRDIQGKRLRHLYESGRRSTSKPHWHHYLSPQETRAAQFVSLQIPREMDGF